jgi:hypothetical protein
METGRLDDGLGALTEALATAHEYEDRHNRAEMHRLKGELLLRQHDSHTADGERDSRCASINTIEQSKFERGRIPSLRK